VTGDLPHGGEKISDGRGEEVSPQLEEIFKKTYTHKNLRFPNGQALFEHLKKEFPNLVPAKQPKPSLLVSHNKGEAPTQKESQKGIEDFELAGFGPRAGAFLLDVIVLALFWLAFAIPIAKSSHWDDDLGLSILIFSALYFILCPVLLGGTLGKLIMGLRIVSKEGKNPGLFQSILRFLGYFFSVILFGFGFYMISFHPQKRGLHDLMGKTFVVREKND
ncbi:MAG: RDD family protein, partial [Planctomycetota bacterium]